MVGDIAAMLHNFSRLTEPINYYFLFVLHIGGQQYINSMIKYIILCRMFILLFKHSLVFFFFLILLI